MSPEAEALLLARLNAIEARLAALERTAGSGAPADPFAPRRAPSGPWNSMLMRSEVAAILAGFPGRRLTGRQVRALLAERGIRCSLKTAYNALNAVRGKP